MKKNSLNRLERIARNINAMDLNYDYIDQHSKWKFWHDLRGKLFRILDTLPQSDKDVVKSFCRENKAEYFGLV